MIVATDGTVIVSVTAVVVGVVVVVVVVEGPVGVVDTVTVVEGAGDVAGVGGEGSVVGVGVGVGAGEDAAGAGSGVGVGVGEDVAGAGRGEVVNVVVPVVGAAGVETGREGVVLELGTAGRGPSEVGAFGAVAAPVVGGRRVVGSSNGGDESGDAAPAWPEAVPADLCEGLAAGLVGDAVGPFPGRAFVATKSVRPPSDGGASFCTNPT